MNNEEKQAKVDKRPAVEIVDTSEANVTGIEKTTAGSPVNSDPNKVGNRPTKRKIDPAKLREIIGSWLHTSEIVLIQIFVIVILVIKLSQFVMNAV